VIKRIARIGIAVVGAAGGVLAAYRLLDPLERLTQTHFSLWQNLVVMTLGGLVLGLCAWGLAPFIITFVWQSTNWVEGRLQKAPVQDIMAGSDCGNLPSHRWEPRPRVSRAERGR